MNKQRILDLADHIEHLPHVTGCDAVPGVDSFTMEYVRYNCGTPACICGWAAHFLGNPNRLSYEKDAADYLGLDERWARVHLFYPRGTGCNLSELTPQRAAEALRRLANYKGDFRLLGVYSLWC